MSQRYWWLNCQASRGQFDDEVAVSGTEHNGEWFSLFANREFVECEGELGDDSVAALLQVVEFARDGQLVLVRLPGPTLSNGQTVTVQAGELKEFREHQVV